MRVVLTLRKLKLLLSLLVLVLPTLVFAGVETNGVTVWDMVSGKTVFQVNPNTGVSQYVQSGGFNSVGGVIHSEDIDYTTGVTLPRVSGVTANVQTQINNLYGGLSGTTVSLSQDLTYHTNANAFVGVSDFATDSQVSTYVQAQVSGYPYNASVSAWLVDARNTVNSQVTAYAQSQVSQYPYNASVSAWLTNYTPSTGVSAFVIAQDQNVHSQVSSYVQSQVSKYPSAPTADSMLYVDASGMVKTALLGANGTYLKSQGAGAAFTWDTPTGTGTGSGSGATTFDSQSGYALASEHGGAIRMGISGTQGITTSASGETVFVSGNGALSQVSSYVQSQVSQYPVNASVSAWIVDAKNVVNSQVSGFVSAGISTFGITSYQAGNPVLIAGSGVTLLSGVSVTGGQAFINKGLLIGGNIYGAKSFKVLIKGSSTETPAITFENVNNYQWHMGGWTTADAFALTRTGVKDYFKLDNAAGTISLAAPTTITGNLTIQGLSSSTSGFSTGSQTLIGPDISQLHTLAAGNSPYASNTYLSAGAISGSSLWSGVSSYIAQAANVTGYVQAQVSGYPYSVQVTSWVQNQVSGYPYTAQVSSWAIDGNSQFVTNTNLAAVGAPGTTSGTSLWAGATPYIVESSGIGSVTNWITAAVSGFSTGGTGTTTTGSYAWTGENEFSKAQSGVSLVTVYGSKALTPKEAASTFIVIRTPPGGTPPTIQISGTSPFISAFDRYGSGATIWTSGTLLYDSGSQFQTGNTLFWNAGVSGFQAQFISIGSNEYVVTHNAPSNGTLSGSTPFFK